MGTLLNVWLNTKNVSDSSPPREIEYHITVSHILGAGSKELCAHRAGEKTPKLCSM